MPYILYTLEHTAHRFCGLSVWTSTMSMQNDSRSLTGMANGSVAEREVHMSEFSDACKTLVTKQYTFTYYPFTASTCLYDRINDPLEMTNLSGRPEYADLERNLLISAIDRSNTCSLGGRRNHRGNLFDVSALIQLRVGGGIDLRRGY